MKHLPIPNLFLDTNIILDYILPSRRAEWACSFKLIENVKLGGFKAWSADYALSETLGELKRAREERIGVSHLFKEVLSQHEISQMIKIVNEFRKTPNFRVFKPDPISQEEIFDKVKELCVQATDALVLLSALGLEEKLGNTILVTRDDRLLARGKKLVPTAHPRDLVGSCPTNCTNKSICRHYK